MERLASFVLRHRKVVVLAWVLVFLAGGVAAGRVADRLTFDFSLPGQPGYETEVEVAELYGTSTFDTYVPVLTVPEGTTVEEQSAQVAAVFDAVRSAVPGVRCQVTVPRWTDDFGRTFLIIGEDPSECRWPDAPSARSWRCAPPTPRNAAARPPGARAGW